MMTHDAQGKDLRSDKGNLHAFSDGKTDFTLEFPSFEIPRRKTEIAIERCKNAAKKKTHGTRIAAFQKRN